MHTITGKLNKDARQHQGNAGTVFFVSLGEKHYDRKTKTSGWTNYEAALFAKDTQVQYYTDNLKAGAIISVGGSSLIVELDANGQFPPRLAIQDSKLLFASTPATPMPESVRQQAQQRAPKQQAPPQYQQPPPQQAPAGQQINSPQQAMDQYNNQPDPATLYDDDIPF